MKIKIRKRDGRLDNFSKNKIINAILAAFESVDGELTDYAYVKAGNIADYIEEQAENREDILNIEEIQDMVEKGLMSLKKKDVAKAYIIYREERAKARGNLTDNTILDYLAGNSEYWNNENSNKDAQIVTTQRDYLAGIASTDIARRFLLPKEVCEAHDQGIIHQHDMDYMAQNALTNCFSSDTAFVTKQGVKTFNDFYDGAPVEVRDKNGDWRTATVKYFGQQPLYTITLSSGNSITEVKCTRNHRWILKNGEVTENLQIGDRLALLPDVTQNSFNEIKTLEDYQTYCYGFILGDGSDISNNRGVRVRLCGEKINQETFFQKAGYFKSASTFENSNDIQYINKDAIFKTNFLQNKMWKAMSSKQKAILFLGLYAADGCKDRNMIATANEDILELIKDISAIAGYYISSININTKSTNYSKNRKLYEIRFRKNTPANKNWIVKDIQKTLNNNHNFDVWCVVEPKTHSFTLASGIVTGNCCLINLEDMLQNGTIINGIRIDPQHRISTAATVATQIITAVASSQYGGTTISLAHLAPFVRMSYKEHLNKYLNRKIENNLAEQFAKEDLQKEIKDAVQTFNYQINSMSTTNGQAPFLSVVMWVGENPEYEKENAMLIEEFLKQRIQGMKNEKGVYITPAFPKLLYILDENNIYENSQYWYLTELSAKCTAKRMVPDYISAKKMREYKINKFGKGDVYGCMGCRSFLTPDRCTENYAHALNYDPNKGKYYGRLNMGVTTINLADAAFSSQKDFDKFWQLMEERTELCHKGLKARIDRLEKVTSDVAPILWQDGAFARLDKGEKLTDLIHHGYATASLGYAALYECVKYMTGHSHSDGAEGEKFGLQVMQFLNDKCSQWKQEEDIDYSVYGSPIESTTYKFAKCLKKRFGEDIFIKLDGKDRSYITNSYHIPVFEEISAFDKLEIESKFQRLSPGGAISYIETSNLDQNISAVLTVMQFIYNHIMYAELNTKSDFCQECGYTGEILIDNKNEWYCPNCGNRDHNKLNVARRTCGYIGTHFWNYGRTEEIKDRYVHLGGDN